MTKKHQSKRLLLVNIIGAFGYISCVLQWMWLAVLTLPSLLNNSDLRSFFVPAPSAEPRQVEPFIDGSSLVITVIAIAITILILIITVIVLVRLPVSIARGGKKAVNAATEAVIPVVTHHKKIPAAKKRKLSIQISKYVKLTLCLLPAMLLGLVFVVPSGLDRDISLIVGMALAIGSLLWFTLEYAAAKLLGVPLSKIV